MYRSSVCICTTPTVIKTADIVQTPSLSLSHLLSRLTHCPSSLDYRTIGRRRIAPLYNTHSVTLLLLVYARLITLTV